MPSTSSSSPIKALQAYSAPHSRQDLENTLVNEKLLELRKFDEFWPLLELNPQEVPNLGSYTAEIHAKADDFCKLMNKLSRDVYKRICHGEPAFRLFTKVLHGLILL